MRSSEKRNVKKRLHVANDNVREACDESIASVIEQRIGQRICQRSVEMVLADSD